MNFKILRDQMVKEQLVRRGITDKKVLEAFRKVPRHKFIPAKYLSVAYDDNPLPIGEGQTISQPYIVALVSESLKLVGNERVLEIGAGSGYQAAILAELTEEVYSVERIATLAQGAERILRKLGYGNVSIKCADGSLGWKDFSPYLSIVVAAAAPEIPEPLIEQLGQGGRIVAPLGGNFSQVLTLLEKKKDKVSQSPICGCAFVPLIGKYGRKDAN